MKLTILSVAFPLFPVSSDSGGGSEQILHLLDKGLVNAGHRSLVIGAKTSCIHGELIEAPHYEAQINENLRQWARNAHKTLINEALDRYPIDLIHFHGLDFYTYLPHTGKPMLATLHLPAAWYPNSIFQLPHVQLNCVSKAQAGSMTETSNLPVVRNGIDTHRYLTQNQSRENLLFIARICPEKGVHLALQVARRLDLPLIVAGPVHAFKEHQDYFLNCVKPLLDSKRQYVGPVGLEQKVSLLAQAKCLLIPSLAPETSSLVAMEAASAGTPVIAFRSGALPEVVEHTRTGFIVDSEDEMAGAIGKVHLISPEACRSIARSRFDACRMLNDYLALYKSMSIS